MIMRKKILYFVVLSTIAWGMSACKEGEPGFGYLSNLTQHDRNRILNDTITPPNNPMAPGENPDCYTIRGVLTGELLSVMQTEGYHPCIIVNDTVQRERRGYFLFKGNEPIRFNSPDLAGRKIGDTLYVTGEVTYRAGAYYALEYVAIQ